MPPSFVGRFSEPDQLGAAFTAARIQSTVTQPGQYDANLVAMDIGQLSLAQGEDNLGTVRHIELVPDQIMFCFLPGGHHGVLIDGNEVRRHQLTQHSLGQSYYHTTLGPAPWAALFLTPEKLEGIATLFGSQRRSPHVAHAIMPSAQAMQRLTRLHIMAVRLVRDAPEMLERPEAIRGLEHTVIEALAGCLIGGEAPDETFGQRNHSTIMRRFHRLMADNPAGTLFLADICAALGVSARSLRDCSQTHIGMGPKRFLTLRRMHLARCALREGGGNTSVTDVATQFGFWELGRFAVVYRALFGESPSATAGQRAPGDGPHAVAADLAAPNHPVHDWFGPQWIAALGWAQGGSQPFGFA
jgi:AraC-like DNA-binding protein